MTDKYKGNLLVVDDSADIRLILEQFFQIEGFEVVSAQHGLEALELLNNGLRPDLILVDLLMPVMDGFQFCEELKKQTKFEKIPVVIMTGGSPAEVKTAQDLSQEILQKPMNFKEMLKVVERKVSHIKKFEEGLESHILQDQNDQSNHRAARDNSSRQGFLVIHHHPVG